MVKEPTCFKNFVKPSCIDLFLTNCTRSFQDTQVVETGLSDFHKMIITVLKVFFPKQKHETVFYRNYKNFENSHFRDKIENELLKHDKNNIELDIFHNFLLSALNECAPFKQKHISASNGGFVTKELRKEIMKRTRLRNNFLKKKDDFSKALYNKQRNICVSLVRKSKREYYENLDVECVQDNKNFWKKASSLLSNKIKSKEKIAVVENAEIVTEDSKLVKIFNDFFSTVVDKLNIAINDDHISETSSSDPVWASIERFSKHPSILNIKKEWAIFLQNLNFNMLTKIRFLKKYKTLTLRKPCSKMIYR